MPLCKNWQQDDDCVRSLYASVLPLSVILAAIVWSLPIRYPRVLATLKSPFVTFLALNDALQISQPENLAKKPFESSTPVWRSLVIASLSALEAISWIAIAAFRIFVNSHDSTLSYPPYTIYTPALIASTWIYAAVKPILRPIPTAPYDLFLLFLLHLTMAILSLGTMIYQFYSEATGSWPPKEILSATIANTVTTLALLCVVLNMPLHIPGPNINENLIGKEIAPEDYTTLWGWISFNWVDDLISRGTKSDLNEEDVPKLSPTMQSKPIFQRFSELRSSSLLRQIVAANSLDMILDFNLTMLSTVLNYITPYLLKEILRAFEENTPQAKSRAYVYASITFLAAAAKAEADLQHLWFGRRASTRIRSELMASIYEKALKRKDFSGIVRPTEKQSQPSDPNPTSSSKTAIAHSRSPSLASKSSKTSQKPKSADPTDLAKEGADIGKIVQLMSADANRIAMMVTTGYFIYGSPVEIVIASIMLYKILGWSAFAGFGVLVFITPLNHLLSKRGVAISRGLSAARDSRMATLNELVGAVSFIKFFAWELQWIKRVEDARSHELRWLIKERFNSIMFGLLWTIAPVLVSIVSFLTFVYQGNQLSISTAFTAIALFSMLKMPLNVIPMFIVQLLQAGVALDRIATFLEEEEVPEYVSSFKRTAVTKPPSPQDEVLGISNGSFQWNQVKSPKTVPTAENPTSPTEESTPFELRDINVIFPPGKMSLVTGGTASGKTALLMALLGEMTMLSENPDSQVYLPKNPTQVDSTTGLKNSISYCAQTPWLEHASIRQNILFGSPYEPRRYDEVIEYCALKPDLERFEDGDETEIGARGVSLSGGQKARVALARAVYARTKHVLLDDPLAAVDSHTARVLFEKLLMGPLLSGRTVVLVTHHIDLVRSGAYYLIRMLDGRIDTQGTLAELEDRGLLDIIVHSSILDSPQRTTIDEDDGEKMKASSPKPFVKTGSTSSTTGTPIMSTRTTPRRLVKDEVRSKGTVKWNIYKTYLQASSWGTWVALFVLVVSYQLFGVMEKLWIREWGLHYPEGLSSATTSLLNVDPHASPDLLASGPVTTVLPFPQVVFQEHAIQVAPELPPADTHPLFYVLVYASIGMGAALLSTINSTVQYMGAYRASKKLFTRLLRVVVGSPMRFFDTTPTGRILNRFSRDIEVVDSSLSGSLRSTTSWVATFIASVLTVCVVLPQLLLPAILIAYGYYRLSYGYVVAGRSLRRMESTTRSPIFAAFGDMLEGLVTVRAFSSEEKFLDNMHEKVDVTTTMWYNFWMCNRWLLLRFDLLGGISTLLTTIFALMRLDAGLAGLTITSAMAFTNSVYWTCRMITQLEMDLNSVERVVEYLDLPQEPPAIVESNRVPAFWPSSSENASLVVVENLVVKYSPELPPVLHGVSFTLKARERVGLLGRTGSGKSTLAMSLLRFVDPERGRIVIDGIDISKIGTHDLRSRLTIIPQDAVLFSGTIRDNLDPFGDHSDEECLAALSRVQLITDSPRRSGQSSGASSVLEGRQTVDSDALSEAATETSEHRGHVGLDTRVSAGGSNFSQGQRQLVAMARALLRQSSIIIMDEATSSIDFETDKLVQRTVREDFPNSLLITIAHRIKTIIDYDRLVVLDKGQMVEFDTPAKLIRKEGGIFRAMCLKSGYYDELLGLV